MVSMKIAEYSKKQLFSSWPVALNQSHWRTTKKQTIQIKKKVQMNIIDKTFE